MRFFMVTLWLFSVGGYFFNLFTTYGNLTPHISFPLLGGFVSKDTYFFGFTALFLIFTYVFYGLYMVVNKLPKQLFVVPNKSFWIQSASSFKALKYLLGNWLLVMASVVNYFLIYIMLIAEAHNHFEGETDNALNWFYWPGLVMLALLPLPYFRLFISKENLIER